ncbi:MAG: DNA glycosylase AlkZ-like family protein [Acidimicrobiia bacterium]
MAVAERLVGLHASDPATVFLAAAARLRKPSVAGIEQALYDDRSLVRTLCMRRTMFVVPVELVPIVQAAVTDALVPASASASCA